MKNLIWIVLAGILAVGLISCGKGKSNIPNERSSSNLLYNSQENIAVVSSSEENLITAINSLLSSNGLMIDSSFTIDGQTTTVAHNSYNNGKKVIFFVVYSKVIDHSYYTSCVVAIYGKHNQSCNDKDRELMNLAGKTLSDAIKERAESY